MKLGIEDSEGWLDYRRLGFTNAVKVYTREGVLIASVFGSDHFELDGVISAVPENDECGFPCLKVVVDWARPAKEVNHA